MIVMEWKIYLRHREKAYRILKLRQGANYDITIVPKNAVLFSREGIKREGVEDAKAVLKKEKVRVAEVSQVASIVRDVGPQLALSL